MSSSCERNGDSSQRACSPRTTGLVGDGEAEAANEEEMTKLICHSNWRSEVNEFFAISDEVFSYPRET
jgi:hypothetical protein